MIKTFISLILLLIFVQTFGQGNNTQLIWSIGKTDNSYSEFALTPDKYGDFVPEGFGGANRYYVIGESNASKDCPYILPGPDDHFVGGSFWGGLALNKLPIYFEIESLPKKGFCSIDIDILEVSSKKAPLFRCYINGNKYEYQLTPDLSGEEPKSIKNNPQKVSFQIPVSHLKNGVNSVVFQNMNGKWCIFDAINFSGPSGLKINKPGKTLVHSVSFADFEMKQDGNIFIPLHVDLHHKGKRAVIKAVIDGITTQHEMDEGHSVLEFLHPVPSKKRSLKVEIYMNNQLKFSDKLLCFPAEEIEYCDYVNQFMGTGGSRWMIAPGPWMPMSMVKIAPENEDHKWKAGYEYQIENVMGFSHIHDWTMAGLMMMPTNGELIIEPGISTDPDSGYRSRIDKQKEKAEIGKYETYLTDYDIKAELTATTRASMQRYTFPDDRENRVLIDLKFPSEYKWNLQDAELKQISETEIEGWAKSNCSITGYEGQQDYKLHFFIQLSQPIKQLDGWVQNEIVMNTKLINKSKGKAEWNLAHKDSIIKDAGLILNFTKGTKELKIRTGISLVSVDQAKLNLQEEMVKPFDWDFEAIVENQRNEWNKLLGRVEIETNDYLQKVKFYTNLYRCISPRNTWNDINGKWVDMNEEVQQTDPSKPLYGSDAYWGTHWNLVQFYNLIMPEYSSNWINTFLEMYDKGGWLPIGNPGLEYYRVMVGQPAIPLIVSAYQHGIRDFDTDKMYEAIYHQQTTLIQDHPGGGSVGNESYNHYLTKGYVPLNKDYQSYVSNTMEYAYQDYAVAQYSKAIGIDSTYHVFMKRSENWKNTFDKELGWVRPRTLSGEWYKDFSPFHAPEFCESNSWQYSWYVPHNVSELVKVIGKDRFIDRLSKGMQTSEKVYFNALGDNFLKYPINHGNQSNMQSCYLFNHANEPWLTQHWARAIQEKYYGMGARDAYPGDEDQGQMSSWYVMSSIGLFEMDGGVSIDPHYEIGSPRFEKVTIHLSDKYYNGNTFVIEAKNASRENKYIQSAFLNGKKLNSWKFSYNELVNGGNLQLEMGNTPNKNIFKK